MVYLKHPGSPANALAQAHAATAARRAARLPSSGPAAARLQDVVDEQGREIESLKGVMESLRARASAQDAEIKKLREVLSTFVRDEEYRESIRGLSKANLEIRGSVNEVRRKLELSPCRTDIHEEEESSSSAEESSSGEDSEDTTSGDEEEEGSEADSGEPENEAGMYITYLH
jgi:hypothetical protein